MKFYWVLFLLWLCGYITLKQLIVIYLFLIGGIILYILAPIISLIYTIPERNIGLKPAMILFSKISNQNIEKLNSLKEEELKEAVAKFSSASEIIINNFSNSPEILEKYPEISEVFQDIDTSIKKAKNLYEAKKQCREEREDQERRKKERYWQDVRKEREKRKLSRGVPPIDEYNCPNSHPIRATNIDRQGDFGGIYYFPDERRGVKVYWCFANAEEAKVEKFRRPLRTPPKQQPL
ncbi:MAG: hypothetical protein WBA93_22745 [Microcoleaceae cyanobacterium]